MQITCTLYDRIPDLNLHNNSHFLPLFSKRKPIDQDYCISHPTKNSMARGSIGLSSLLAATTILATLVAVAPLSVEASDPDPLQDFCIADLTSWTHVNGYTCRNPAKATNEDFVYRGLRHGGDTSKSYGAPLTKAFAQEWPALNAQGISWARIDYAPDDLNTLHWHPRASEILYCQEGTLFAGFVDSATNRLWYSILQKGDLMLFPRGLLHFELNIGKGPAMAQLAHNSQYGGQQNVGRSTFGSYPTIRDDILKKGFDLDDETLQRLKKFFSKETVGSSVESSDPVIRLLEFDL